MDSDARGALARDLGWGLRTVATTFQFEAGPFVADLPGGPRGYLVLVAIGAGDHPSQLALAHELRIHKTAMTALLDGLELAGLVRRAPDPADRRARLLTITSEGRAVLERTRSEIERAEARLLCPLDVEERATMRDLLARMALHVHTVAADDPCTSGDDMPPTS